MTQTFETQFLKVLVKAFFFFFYKESVRTLLKILFPSVSLNVDLPLYASLRDKKFRVLTRAR